MLLWELKGPIVLFHLLFCECLFSAVPFLPYTQLIHSGENKILAQRKAFPTLSERSTC